MVVYCSLDTGVADPREEPRAECCVATVEIGRGQADGGNDEFTQYCSGLEIVKVIAVS